MVNGVGLGEDELADGHHGVAVVDETGEDGGQGLRRVQRGVVEQHDAALLHPAGHPLADGVRVVVLPVQGVPIGNDLKPLRRKGLRGCRLICGFFSCNTHQAASQEGWKIRAQHLRRSESHTTYRVL